MKRPGGPRGGAEGSTEPPEPRHNDRVNFSWNQVALLRRFRFGNDWEEAMPDANYFANWHGGAALSRRVQTYRR